MSARTWPTNTSNANPAFYIDINSNVGIGTANPGALLDVVGQGRFQAVSTLSLNISSINGTTFGSPINSTVIGLGSAGYVSTASLISTTASFQGGYATAGFLSTLNLTSTVTGLGSIGYVSTASLISTTAALQTAYGTAGFLSTPNLTSTVTGLGTTGFLSSFNRVLSISSQQIVTSSLYGSMADATTVVVYNI